MLEKFTDRSRTVVALANEEAQRLNQEYVGTEHILLGLVREGDGVAAHILRCLNVDSQKIQDCIQRDFPQGEVVLLADGQRTPGAKKVIEDSLEEAHKLGHHYVGTEHLLLALLRDRDSVAAQILLNLGLELAAVRKEVLCLLGHSED
jgi:ATP-dependent Clp protease ATP-binding subunit ClpC